MKVTPSSDVYPRLLASLYPSAVGCAVLAAIENGRLDTERLENRRKLEREQQFLERKMDPEAQAKYTNRVRALHRGVRKMYDERKKGGGKE